MKFEEGKKIVVSEREDICTYKLYSKYNSKVNFQNGVQIPTEFSKSGPCTIFVDSKNLLHNPYGYAYMKNGINSYYIHGHVVEEKVIILNRRLRLLYK